MDSIIVRAYEHTGDRELVAVVPLTLKQDAAEADIIALSRKHCGRSAGSRKPRSNPFGIGSTHQSHVCAASYKEQIPKKAPAVQKDTGAVVG